MDLNQAEVAVTTQHLIDIRQEKDNWLQMSDFGDMGEFPLHLLRHVPGRGEPGVQVHAVGRDSRLADKQAVAVPQLL